MWVWGSWRRRENRRVGRPLSPAPRSVVAVPVAAARKRTPPGDRRGRVAKTWCPWPNLARASRSVESDRNRVVASHGGGIVREVLLRNRAVENTCTPDRSWAQDLGRSDLGYHASTNGGGCGGNGPQDPDGDERGRSVRQGGRARRHGRGAVERTLPPGPRRSDRAAALLLGRRRTAAAHRWSARGAARSARGVGGGLRQPASRMPTCRSTSSITRSSSAATASTAPGPSPPSATTSGVSPC